MPIVAEQYTFVIGVGTHAATHSLALVIAATGAVVDGAVPNAPAGLDRALTWIFNRIDGRSALVVIEGVGSYGAGLAQRVTEAGVLVAEPSAMPAPRVAGSARPMPWMRSVSHARSWRSTPHGCGGPEPPAAGRAAGAGRGPYRWSLSGPRAINALTALLRTIDLGVDTRKALLHSQFKVIAGWRHRREDSVVRTCRQEAIRLAKHIVALDGELVDNRKALDVAVETSPRTVGAARRRLGDRCVCPDGLVSSWPRPFRSGVRRAGGDLPDTSVLGKHPEIQTQSRRRSTPQPSTYHRGHRPHAHPCPHPGLRRPAPSRRPDHQGDHALTQALHHPTTLPDPRLSTSHPDNPLTRYRSIWKCGGS